MSISTKALQIEGQKGIIRDGKIQASLSINCEEGFGDIHLEILIYQWTHGELVEHSYPITVKDKKNKLILEEVPIPNELLPIKRIEVKANKAGENINITYKNEWYLKDLYIVSKKEFNKKMYSSHQRITDKETLMFNSLQIALYSDYSIHYSIASFVVFCYKAIELENKDILNEYYHLFEEFQLKMPMEITNGRVERLREDDRQMILSISTVKWHVDIFLEQFDLVDENFNHVLMKVSKGSYFEPSLSKSLGNILLLYGYAQHISGNEESSKFLWEQLYDFYRKLGGNLPEKPIHPSHLNDIDNCRKATYLALCGILGISKKENPRAQKLNNDSVFTVVVRVKNLPSFKEAFEKYLTYCTIQKIKPFNNVVITSFPIESAYDNTLLEENLKKHKNQIKKYKLQLEKQSLEIEELSNKNNQLKNSKAMKYTTVIRKLFSKIK